MKAKFNEAAALRKKWEYEAAFNIFSELVNYAPAQNQLGEMHQKGLHVEKDYKEAIKCFTKAADQGFGKANYNLGVMHEEGEGVEKDKQKAFDYYKLGADQCCVESLHHLGYAYKNGWYGVKQNYKKAIEYFTKAANQGYSYSQYALAMMHHLGEGVDKDDNKALELFKQAAEQNYPTAQVMIDEINKEPHCFSIMQKEYDEVKRKRKNDC